jgi:hypothetical protein
VSSGGSRFSRRGELFEEVMDAMGRRGDQKQ